MIKTITQEFATRSQSDVDDADAQINDYTEVGWTRQVTHMAYMNYERLTDSGFKAIDPTGWTVRTFILEWPHQNDPVYP